jgi:hypothetical protein
MWLKRLLGVMIVLRVRVWVDMVVGVSGIVGVRM